MTAKEAWIAECERQIEAVQELLDIRTESLIKVLGERDELQAYLDKVLKYQHEGVLVYERMAAEFNEWRDKAINRKEGLRFALLGVDDLRHQLQEARKG